MVNSVLKILGVGGSLFIGVGTLLGSSASPTPKIDWEEITTVSSARNKRGPRSCTIYEAVGPTWHEGRRVFLQMKKKFNGPEEFFKTIGNVWNIDELRKKIGIRCNEKKNTYLWYGDVENKGKTWIYASDMNEGGYDWVKANRVIKESRDVLKEDEE